ncbi:LPXTG cell wall anchor domain-containing protein [Streptomyces sp. NPDC020983]|uniref:LPXTG cell wall anchor domain-containing protein n=1 Tax=Streptomyces sp. NPDC020983 TaxID=3365106 RepID=UPI00378B6B1C
MTAPLTPHDHSSPLPRHPGADGGPGKSGDLRKEALAETGRGVLTAVLVAVCGVALGLLWLWLSPRVPLVSDGKAVYLKDTEGEEAIGGDGTFALIAAGLGLLTGAVVFWRRRQGGIGVVLGLAAGGVLASVIGWRIGVWLGPDTNIAAHAMRVGPKVVFDAPLELRAKSALVAWPAAAMVVHLLLTSAFGPRDTPEPLPSEKPFTPYWAPPAGPPAASGPATPPPPPGPEQE